MLKYWVWLSELKGLRNQTKLALLRRFGDPESIFYADPDELMLTEGADPGQLKLLENHDLAPADKILADCITRTSFLTVFLIALGRVNTCLFGLF